MDFDFHKQYEHYTVRELLDIVENAGKYQPSAVAAAKDLLELKDRRVVADELQRLHPVAQQPDEAPVASIFDESPPSYDPRHVITVKALLALIPLFFAARAGWHLIAFILDPKVETFAYGVVMLLSPLIPILLYVCTAVMLWRKIGAGWYFGAIMASFSLISVLGTVLFFIQSEAGHYLQGMLLVNAVDIVLNGLMMFLLLMSVTLDTFDVSGRSRYWTIGLSAAFAIAYNYYRFSVLIGL